MDASPNMVSVADSISIPYAYPATEVPSRSRSSPEFTDEIPTVDAAPVPTKDESTSATSQPSRTIALSPMVTVLSLLWMVTLSQSLKSNPTAFGAVRPALIPMVLFSTAGPLYPPAAVP